MRLDAPFLVELRELVSNDAISQLADFSFSELTIGAVVELACVRASANGRLRSVFDQWAESSEVLNDAFQVLEQGTLPSRADMWAARKVDFFPVRGTRWSDDRNYHPFESRFRKAAKEAGFGDKADSLTGALFEMADNIAQHSGPSSITPCPGLIGYYAHDGHVAFAVGDSGRGVLASLKTNPAWAQLPNSKEALVAIIENQASRRANLGHGEGFKQVFRSLADLNGLVFLCSMEGRLRLHQSPTGRQATAEFTGAFPGVQLSVNCSLNGMPQEREISI